MTGKRIHKAHSLSTPFYTFGMIISGLQRSREGTTVSFIVPLGDPFIRAKRVVGTLELLARRKVFTLGSYALEIIGVVLKTVPSLVGIGETSIESSSLQDVFAREVGHCEQGGVWPIEEVVVIRIQPRA